MTDDEEHMGRRRAPADVAGRAWWRDAVSPASVSGCSTPTIGSATGVCATDDGWISCLPESWI